MLTSFQRKLGAHKRFQQKVGAAVTRRGGGRPSAHARSRKQRDDADRTERVAIHVHRAGVPRVKDGRQYHRRVDGRARHSIHRPSPQPDGY